VGTDRCPIKNRKIPQRGISIDREIVVLSPMVSPHTTPILCNHTPHFINLNNTCPRHATDAHFYPYQGTRCTGRTARAADGDWQES
jgi:hypothetical protein